MNLRTFTICWLAMLLSPIAAAAGTVIYVDDDAPGGDGSSWAMAFKYLQDALAAADANDEIRVAQGTYIPDQNSVNPGGSGDREATFQLITGVTIKGGYAGSGEADPNERDVAAYETILSGDLNGDDGPDFANNSENSYLVVTGSGTQETAVLDGFTITGGSGSNGGGMCNNSGDPTIINCTFMENWAERRGGGMYNTASSPTITDCLFIGNLVGRPNHSTRDGGGGAMHNINSSPTLTNCIFGGNVSVTGEGGGMCNYEGSEPMLVNCTFSGNSASDNYGGGMYNESASPAIINCTFSGNSAEVAGGGMYNRSANPMLINCILWANSYIEGTMDESAQIAGGTPLVSYSCIQGLDGFAGEHNIEVEPLFVDADGHDNVFGTRDDNLRLSGNSFCVNAGNNSAVPASVVTDLDGKARITHGIVDMGAYENPDPDFFFFVSDESVTVPEGQTATFGVALVMDPNGTVEVTVSCEAGEVDVDITVEAGAALRFDSSDYSAPQTVTLAAAEDVDNLNGVVTIRVSAPGFATAEVTATEMDNDSIPSVLYVDDSAAGVNNGSSWAEAYVELRDAMTIAAAFPEDVDEIRVGEGIYKPAESSGDRKATFQLINGVTIKGGYAGFGAPDPNERDINAHETVLSGDLNGDDSSGGDNPENSYHVVSVGVVDPNTIIDGLTITGGNADGVYPNPNHSGGGMSNSHGSPTLINCTFRGNYAWHQGAGMSNSYGSPILDNCTFSENSSFSGAGGGNGGGMSNAHGTPVLTGCVFSGNSSGSGGGMYNSSFWYDGDSPTLVDCTFRGNHAYWEGGGMSCNYDSPTFINCTFSGNSAGYAGGVGYDGGAVSGHQTSATLINCTFSGNSADSDGGAIMFGHSTHAPSTLTNCIFWGNDADEGPQISLHQSALSVSYCDIQGGQMDIALGSAEVYWLSGNIDVDPCFVDADNDDCHLRWNSACINTGDPTFVAAPDEKDIDGEPRVMGGRVDMGVDEVGEKQADFTRDGVINLEDFSVFSQSWPENVPGGEWYVLCDLYEDEQINALDMAEFVEDWLWRADWYEP